MNLLRLAPVVDRLAAVGDEQPVVVLDAARCVRRLNRASACALCADGCPTAAITVAEGDVALDPAACAGCGLCLHACPLGAFGGEDETAAVWRTAANLLPCDTLEICCSAVSPAAVSPAAAAFPPADAILQVRSCLAALDPATYLGLAVLGVRRVNLRLAACVRCPLGSLRPAIEATAADAALLAAIAILPVDAAPAAAQAPTPQVRAPQSGASSSAAQRTVPVYSTRAPQISRRSLLRRFTGGEPHAPAALPLLAPLEPVGDSPKVMPRTRRALLHACAHLPGASRTASPYFPRFAVDDSCTGCGVCATVCPTGALQLDRTVAAPAGSVTAVGAAHPADRATFRLHYAPLACTGCGLCRELCAPRALQPAAAVDYAAAEPTILFEAVESRCTRCQAPFVGPGPLCPPCTFRRRHPAVSLPPPSARA